MTISTTHSRKDYVGNGALDTYPFDFPVLASSDLMVYVAGVLRTLGIHYTVTGTLPGTGNVVFAAAYIPAADAAIIIERESPLTQATDLNAGEQFYEEDLEQMVDKTTVLLQQLKNRSPLLPSGSEVGGPVSLGASVALGYLRWNLTRTAFEAVPMAGVPSTAAEDIVGIFPDIVTIGPWVDSRAYGTFALALAGAAGKTLLISSEISIDADTTIPADVDVMMLRGGSFSIASGKVLTINGPFESGIYKIFSGDGNVSFGNGTKEVYPDWWGCNGNTSPYDTSAVQSAFDSGKKVVFAKSYYVTLVEISGVVQTIDFNGYSLIGISTASLNAVLHITGRQLSLHGVYVNANFNTYGSAIRWFSQDSGTPAQFNKVYGMKVINSTYGLIYGEQAGSPSTDAPQSENAIYSFTSRSVMVPFTGNQSNGFITLFAPILDCAPYEWSSQPGYDDTAFNTAALAFKNIDGNFFVVGGEILKTTSQLGYGYYGKGFSITDATIEVAGSQAYLTGEATIKQSGGAMASDSAPGFVVSEGAIGVLTLMRFKLIRGAGVAAYSGAALIKSNDDSDISSNYTVEMKDSRFVEWGRSHVLNVNYHFTNTRFSGVGVEHIVMNPIYTMAIPMSFEAGEQTATKLYFREDVTILGIRGIVTKAIAGTDSGTISGASQAGATTGGVITAAASDPLNTEYYEIPSANNGVYRNDWGGFFTLTSAKTTAGGKVLIILEYMIGDWWRTH